MFDTAKIAPSLLGILSLVTMLPVAAQSASGSDNDKLSGSQTAAGQAVTEFHRALKSGDRQKAISLLDEHVVIFEGGVERSAQQYAAHHMQADMQYLATINTQLLEHSVTANNNLAYSFAISQVTGRYKEKDLNYQSLESIVLRFTNNEWKIVHIHWSQ